MPTHVPPQRGLIDAHAVSGGELEKMLDRVLAGIRASAPGAVATSKRWLNRELLTDGLAASEAALGELSDEPHQGRELEERMAAFCTAKKARQAQRAAQ